MRKLIVAVMISLDGVIQAPGGPGEDRSSGFALGGWACARSAPRSPRRPVPAECSRLGDACAHRTTYP